MWINKELLCIFIIRKLVQHILSTFSLKQIFEMKRDIGMGCISHPYIFASHASLSCNSSTKITGWGMFFILCHPYIPLHFGEMIFSTCFTYFCIAAYICICFYVHKDSENVVWINKELLCIFIISKMVQHILSTFTLKQIFEMKRDIGMGCIPHPYIFASHASLSCNSSTKITGWGMFFILCHPYIPLHFGEMIFSLVSPRKNSGRYRFKKRCTHGGCTDKMGWRLCDS